jgi:acetyltransferase-like isoleucine patch superfamily enzyme
MTIEHGLNGAQPTKEALEAPAWNGTSSITIGRLARLVWIEAWTLFSRLIIHRGNKDSYLRQLGVRIGQHCDILTAVRNFGTEPWLIELGDRVTITSGVVFLTHDGASRLFRHRLLDASPYGNLFGTIQIRDNSFIGSHAILMPGVVIGPNSIVGAGSVITRDVPPNTVVAGVPARHLYTLDEYIDRSQRKMVPITARSRTELRAELTKMLWGDCR